jgi:flagellar biosynthetic protein FliR
MEWQRATLAQAQVFALILVRVSTLFLVAPVLANARIPGAVKLGLSLIISLLLLMTLQAKVPEAAVTNIFSLTSAAGGEIFVGLAIGYSAFLFFSAIQMAGQILDIQVGFGLVNVVDPGGSDNVSVIGQFYYILAILYFLALDGHHYLIKALGDSFAMIPPGGLSWISHAGAAGPKLSEFFTKLFVIALQLAGPSVATLFLTNVTMGLLSRTIPQMNVFIVGMPLNILVGIGITVLSLKLMGTVLHAVVSSMGEGIARLLAALAA